MNGERRCLRDYLQLPRDAICETSTVKQMLSLDSHPDLMWGAPRSAPKLSQPGAHSSSRDPSCSSSHRKEIWEWVNLILERSQNLAQVLSILTQPLSWGRQRKGNPSQKRVSRCLVEPLYAAAEARQPLSCYFTLHTHEAYNSFASRYSANVWGRFPVIHS